MKRSHVLSTASVLVVVAAFAAAHIGKSIPPGHHPTASLVVAGADRTPVTLAQSSTTSSLLVSPRQLLISVVSGSDATGHLVADYRSGSGFLDVQQDATVFSSIGIGNNNGRYQVDATTTPGLADGVHVGNLQVRMCEDDPCTTPISGTTTSIPYRVTVASTAPIIASTSDWETFQGNARHDGFVPLTLNIAKGVIKRWVWRNQRDTGTGVINPVVTAAGTVFISDDIYYQGNRALFALSEGSGAELWRQDFSDAPGLDPPAVTDGKVFIATTGQNQTGPQNFLYAFNAVDGSPIFRSSFVTQGQSLMAPTIRNGVAYTNAGYMAGGVYAFDATNGTSMWSFENGAVDNSTAAVDDKFVYFYDGSALDVFDAATGHSVVTILDPYLPADDCCYSYHGAPVLGSADHVIAFSGHAWSGNGSSAVGHGTSRKLVDYSISGGIARWATAKTYLTHPAVAKGVVYAGSNDPRSFDAIDEATGAILWQWVPNPNVLGFHRNVLVTNNVAFVSTDEAVYAIDLTTHKPVWSSPTPGSLAMSRSGTLLIVEGAIQPTGRVLAFRFPIGSANGTLGVPLAR